MAGLLDFRCLSVWEVGHCGENVDPDDSNPKKLPRAVRERLRQLLHAISYGMLLPYDIHREEIATKELWFTGFRDTKFAKQLRRYLYERIYDRSFLNSIFVEQDELEKWCWRMNEHLPAFCFTTPRGELVRQSAQTEDKQAARELHDKLKAQSWQVAKLGHKPARLG